MAAKKQKWVRVDTLIPGDMVRHSYEPPGTFEYGRVVCVWSDQNGGQDCYVAFVGQRFDDLFPKKNPDRPYILRYYASSLEKLVLK